VVLLPFLSALMWAMVLAFSLYPLQRRFTRWFRGSRTLAACLVTLTLTVLLAWPVVWIGFGLAEDGKALTAATRKWFLSMPDEAPSWVSRTPVVGGELAHYWVEFALGCKHWMEQLEKASQDPPPRAKIVVESASGVVVDAVPLSSATGIVTESVKPESPELVLMLGRLIAWARTWVLFRGLGGGAQCGAGVGECLSGVFPVARCAGAFGKPGRGGGPPDRRPRPAFDECGRGHRQGGDLRYVHFVIALWVRLRMILSHERKT